MISGPRNSRPTLRGWVNITTGQLVKEVKITKAQIDEWDAAQKKPQSQPQQSLQIDDPLGLGGDPLGLSNDVNMDVDFDIPDDLGLDTIEYTEEQKDILNKLAENRRKLGEAKLKHMKVTGEMDYYKSLVHKLNRKK